MEKLECKKKCMKILFIVSCVTLCIAIALMIVQVFTIILGLELMCEKANVLGRFLNASSIKNIAMTVGLTGVLFTWLLQIMEETECSQPLSVLYAYVFRNYTCQIFVFIVALILCIGFSSPIPPSSFDLLISTFAFLSVLVGIYNMWLLCSLFLFSRENRRNVAFCYLAEMLGKSDRSEDNTKKSEDNTKKSEDNTKKSEDNTKKSEDNTKKSEDNTKKSEDNTKKSEDNTKKMTYLDQWGKEIPRCLRDSEIDHVIQFFQCLVREWEKNNESTSGIWYRNCHIIIRNVVRATEPHLREAIPIYILSANLSPDSLTFILSLYTIALYELFPEEHNEHSSWGNDFYKYVWHYLLELEFPLEKEDSWIQERKYCFYVYCSFVAVMYVLKRDVNTAAINQLKTAYKSMPTLLDDDATFCFNIMKKTICFISNDEENDQVWDLIGRYHRVLFTKLIKPVEDGVMM